MLQYAVIAGLIQFVLHLVQIPDFPVGKSSLHHNTASSTPCFTVAVIRVGGVGEQLFHLFFAAHWASFLTPKFQTLICQSKGPYSTVLLSSLCAPWPTGAFWHCFAISWHQFCYIGQPHRVFSQWMLTHFFTTLVQLYSDVWSSQPSVTQAADSDEIVLCTEKADSIRQAVIQQNIV